MKTLTKNDLNAIAELLDKKLNPVIKEIAGIRKDLSGIKNQMVLISQRVDNIDRRTEALYE